MLKVLPREVIGVPLDSDSVVVLLSALLGSMVLNGFLRWSGIWRISLSRAKLNRVIEHVMRLVKRKINSCVSVLVSKNSMRYQIKKKRHRVPFQPPAWKQNFSLKRIHSQNDSESSVVVVWSRDRALRRFKRLLSSSSARAFRCLTSDCFKATASFYKHVQKSEENRSQKLCKVD